MRYQSTRPKRQFLAGVVCPSCQAQDTIVQIQVFEPEFDEWIECTACQHNERRPTPQQAQMMQQQNAKDDSVGIIKFKP